MNKYRVWFDNYNRQDFPNLREACRFILDTPTTRELDILINQVGEENLGYLLFNPNQTVYIYQGHEIYIEASRKLLKKYKRAIRDIKKKAGRLPAYSTMTLERVNYHHSLRKAVMTENIIDIMEHKTLAWVRFPTRDAPVVNNGGKASLNLLKKVQKELTYVL